MPSICEGKTKKASRFPNLIPKARGVVIQMFHKSQLGENTLKGATKSVGCQNYQKQLKTYLFTTIWDHGNQGMLFFYNTYECQEIQIKNPFDPILSLDFIKDFWKWKFVPFKMDIFTKDFQRTHIIKASW